MRWSTIPVGAGRGCARELPGRADAEVGRAPHHAVERGPAQAELERVGAVVEHDARRARAVDVVVGERVVLGRVAALGEDEVPAGRDCTSADGVGDRGAAAGRALDHHPRQVDGAAAEVLDLEPLAVVAAAAPRLNHDLGDGQRRRRGRLRRAGRPGVVAGIHGSGIVAGVHRRWPGVVTPVRRRLAGIVACVVTGIPRSHVSGVMPRVARPGRVHERRLTRVVESAAALRAAHEPEPAPKHCDERHPGHRAP